MEFLSHLLSNWTFSPQIFVYLTIMAAVGWLAMKVTRVQQLRLSFATVAATVVYFAAMAVFVVAFSIFIGNVEIASEYVGMYIGGGIGAGYFVATTVYYRTLNKLSKTPRLTIG